MPEPTRKPYCSYGLHFPATLYKLPYTTERDTSDAREVGEPNWNACTVLDASDCSEQEGYSYYCHAHTEECDFNRVEG